MRWMYKGEGSTFKWHTRLHHGVLHCYASPQTFTRWWVLRLAGIYSCAPYPPYVHHTSTSCDKCSQAIPIFCCSSASVYSATMDMPATLWKCPASLPLTAEARQSSASVGSISPPRILRSAPTPYVHHTSTSCDKCSQAFPAFCRFSTSVYYTECKPKNKTKRQRPANEAKNPHMELWECMWVHFFRASVDETKSASSASLLRIHYWHTWQKQPHSCLYSCRSNSFGCGLQWSHR